VRTAPLRLFGGGRADCPYAGITRIRSTVGDDPAALSARCLPSSRTHNGSRGSARVVALLREAAYARAAAGLPREPRRPRSPGSRLDGLRRTRCYGRAQFAALAGFASNRPAFLAFGRPRWPGSRARCRHPGDRAPPPGPVRAAVASRCGGLVHRPPHRRRPCRRGGRDAVGRDLRPHLHLHRDRGASLHPAWGGPRQRSSPCGCPTEPSPGSTGSHAHFRCLASPPRGSPSRSASAALSR
jgi:hypothetical protein